MSPRLSILTSRDWRVEEGEGGGGGGRGEGRERRGGRRKG